MSILDQVITATNSGPSIISEQHDENQINWRNAIGDLAEMRGMGASGTMTDRAIARASLAKIGGKIAFVGVGKAWHELGVEVSAALTSKQAMQLASLDYRVAKAQLDFLGAPVDGVFGVGIVGPDGRITPFPGVAVGPKYQVIQQTDAFTMMDSIIGGEHGGRFLTAGAIDGGKKIFACVELPDIVEPVEGDVEHCHLVMTNAHDGSESFNIFPSTHRPVCANTRRIAIAADGKKGFRIRHTRNASSADNAAKAREVLSATSRHFAAYANIARQMPKVEVAPERFLNVVLDDILDITEADARKGSDALASALQVSETERIAAERRFRRQIENRRELLEDILNRAESDRNTAPGSVWGAYQAATEYANHGVKYRGANAESNRVDSILVGRADDISQAAYSVAQSLVVAS